MSKEDNLDAIIKYIEHAHLQFTEPFSHISATVVEASYWTGISKSTILVHINRTFKKKYGEKYIKAQRIAKEIAYGNNPDEERIWSMDVSNQLQATTSSTHKEPKERKKYEFHKDRSEYKLNKSTTVFGVGYKEYTGLGTKENQGLYVACHHYYKKYKEFPWENKEKWEVMCKMYNFEDRRLKEKEV